MLKVRDAACRIPERAKGLNVTVIDGAGLVDWISQRIDDLAPESRNCLGICEVPMVFQT